MAKVTIAGKELDVADDVAAHLNEQAERLAKIEADSRTNAEALGKAKAEADARARTEEEAKRRAEQDALIKKGEYEKAMELERGRVKTVADRMLAAELRAQIAAHPRLRKTGLEEAQRAALIEDAAAQLRAAASFDLDAGQVRFTRDGAPADGRAVIDAFLAARPWLLEPAQNTGTGGDRTRTGTGAPLTGKRSAMSVEERAAFITTHGADAYLALPY